MEQPPVLKANEKLPRGSYFYIQVGHRFYAGEQAETVEVEVSNEEPFLGFFNKDRTMKPGYLARQYREWHWSPWRRGNRAARDRRKGTEPTYMKASPRPKKEIKQELTGRLSPKLVDDAKDAKKHRRQDLVNSACERLKAVYGSLDAKISVRYEKGETK